MPRPKGSKKKNNIINVELEKKSEPAVKAEEPPVKSHVEELKEKIQTLDEQKTVAVAELEKEIVTAVKAQPAIVTDTPAPKTEAPAATAVLTEAEEVLSKVQSPFPVGDWAPPESEKSRKVKKRLSIIISNNHWYEKSLNLDGINIRDCEWDDYGVRKPVFVESGGKLYPYKHSDTIGESPTKLYKAANPEGFKEVFRHRSGLLEKIKIGAMVALVLATFVLIYILINQKPNPDESAMLLQILGGI